MKRIIIPALVAMSLAGAAQAQERPYEQSAQCLAEIGMLTNDRLDFGNPDMVDRAKRKGDALYAAFQRIIDARARTDELHAEFVENHFVQASGYGHAVDLCPYPVDWNDLTKFAKIVDAMKRAALMEGVRITAGADWSTPDRPHFELA